MKILLIGSGKVAEFLVRSMPNVTLVSSDSNLICDLKNSLSGSQIICGECDEEETLQQAGIHDAEVVIVAFEDDDENLRVANIIERYGPRKILIIVKDPSSIPSFHKYGLESVICPLVETVKRIENIVYPQSQKVSEIIVFEESELIGKKLMDIELPANTTIIGVLRGHCLISAERELMLQKGDHIILCTLGILPPVMEEKLFGKGKKPKPFAKVIAAINDKYDLTSVLSEANYLAHYTGSELVVVSTDERIAEMATRALRNSGIDWTTTILEKSNMIQSFFNDSVMSTSEVCLAIRPGDLFFKEVRKLLDNRTSYSGFRAVLLCKGVFPYRRILTLFDGSPGSEKCLDISIRAAINLNSGLHVILPIDLRHEFEDKFLHLKRVGTTYGVEVSEEPVEGNLMIEIVSRIRSGEFDLFAYAISSGAIKKDILNRICAEAPISVLIVTE
ncbi:MAG: NAD-binding protein [Methanomassiliicoccales archaeon]|jgi:trk system potassium uptake protein TrkA|nr:NAD-binding protein [Methanomassiliicoccales archaeon]